MTAAPVILVGVYNGKHVFLPFPQDLLAHETLATQPKTQAEHQLPVLTSSRPPEVQSQSLPWENLRKGVHLDTTPTSGPFHNPVTKMTHMDQRMGTTRQILLPPRR